MGVESGLVPLFEAENGDLINSTKIRYRIPVEDYLQLQRRYSHILKPANQHQLASIRALADKNIKRYNLL
jgi:pyruvate ferredoxin oxidoreductase beta subunit